MSNLITGPDFDGMTIGQLRQYASHMRIALDKTATKEQIIEALIKKAGNKQIVELAVEGQKVKPGYAKIRLHSDPMPGAANLPVPIGVNGYQCRIPRDVDVIVPLRVVRVLNDAVVMKVKQTTAPGPDGREVFNTTYVRVPSYPYTLIAMNDSGPEPLTPFEMSKMRSMGPRRRYRDLFGRWPRPRDLTRAIEQRLIKLDPEENLSTADQNAIGTEDETLG